MDRAGLVGADGATHCGAFDVSFMACLPNMVVMAPSNEAELINMIATSAAIDDRCVTLANQVYDNHSANNQSFSLQLADLLASVSLVEMASAWILLLKALLLT